MILYIYLSGCRFLVSFSIVLFDCRYVLTLVFSANCIVHFSLNNTSFTESQYLQVEKIYTFTLIERPTKAPLFDHLPQQHFLRTLHFRKTLLGLKFFIRLFDQAFIVPEIITKLCGLWRDKCFMRVKTNITNRWIVSKLLCSSNETKTLLM